MCERWTCVKISRPCRDRPSHYPYTYIPLLTYTGSAHVLVHIFIAMEEGMDVYSMPVTAFTVLAFINVTVFVSAVWGRG